MIDIWNVGAPYFGELPKGGAVSCQNIFKDFVTVAKTVMTVFASSCHHLFFKLFIVWHKLYLGVVPY